jgi:predicted ATP-dependent serine protease
MTEIKFKFFIGNCNSCGVYLSKFYGKNKQCKDCWKKKRKILNMQIKADREQMLGEIDRHISKLS